MSGPRFKPGDAVRVRTAHPPGHVRTPYFIRGKRGEVAALAGTYPNPEELAYGRDGTPPLALYRVCFPQSEIWPGYRGPAHDTAVVDIYENWLESAE